MSISPDERYVDGHGVRLRCLAWRGRDAVDPPLVMLHGLWDSSDLFESVAPRLAAKRAVYALDLRGHGGSDRPPTGYLPTNYVDDIVHAIGTLDVPHVDLFGTCLGGYIAIAVSGDPRSSHRVRRCLVIDPWDGGVNRAMVRSFLVLKKKSFEEIVKMLGMMFPTRRRDHLEFGARCLLRTDDGVLRSALDDDWVSEQLTSFLGRCHVPTLVMRYDLAHGGGLGDELLRTLTSTLPNCRTHEFTGHGRELYRDAPDRFVGTLERFLELESPMGPPQELA